MAEVYPYAAMVALWNLPKTIKYKRGSDLVALTRLLPQADDKLKFVGHPPATPGGTDKGGAVSSAEGRFAEAPSPHSW